MAAAAVAGKKGLGAAGAASACAVMPMSGVGTGSLRQGYMGDTELSAIE